MTNEWQSRDLECRGCGAINPAGLKRDLQGKETARPWTGPCPSCGKRYNIISATPKWGKEMIGGPDGAVPLRSVVAEDVKRAKTGVDGFDHVLGGGLVLGKSLLLYGPPGCGKSTILTKVLCGIARQYLRVLYWTGEETTSDIKRRADRIGVKIPDDFVVCDSRNDVDDLIALAEEVRPAVLAVDSIQKLSAQDEMGVIFRPGTSAAISISAMRLHNFCGTHGISLIAIGQINKDETASGPQGLQHELDATFCFEVDEKTRDRYFKPKKNRNGHDGAVARFIMTENGMVDCFKADQERLASERVANAIAEQITPAVSNEETFNPLSWTSPDGTTALTVLAVSCDEPDCRGTVDRACTAGNGAREMGFHPSRIAKGQEYKRGRGVLTLVRDEETNEDEEN